MLTQTLVQRCRATRYPTRTPLGPKFCRGCHLQRTRAERHCDALLGGHCQTCHDPHL